MGVFHYVFRERFLLISMNEEEAERRGWNVRFWDFLFYVSFGFVVTSSVAVAGVLLVFCFLIVPSVTAMLFSERLGAAPRDRLDDGGAGLGRRACCSRSSSTFRPAPPSSAPSVVTLLVVAAARFVVRRLAPASGGTARVVTQSGAR